MSTAFLSLPAPAKVNLFLRILNRRDDGHHNLQTVFQFVNLCDQLTFCSRRDPVVNLKTPLLGMKPSENLVVKAAHLLRDITKCRMGVDISLKKTIPMGAGLGGGSSDAATTLLALNQLWQLNLSQKELRDIGAQLGADVPIFIFGHAAWGEGIGEILSPLILPEPWYLLINPNLPISTAELFQNPGLQRDQSPVSINTFDIYDGENDFEPLVLQQYPRIATIFEWLEPFAKPRLTGTGSVVYATFDTRHEASTIAHLAPEFCHTVVARGLNTTPLHGAMAD